MASIGDLINRCARSIRYVGRGQVLSGAESADALSVASELSDTWEKDGLLTYRTARNTFTWPAATQSRTIGSGFQINIDQPEKIEGAGYMVGTQEMPLGVIQHWEQYKSIPIKTQQATYPSSLYYDRTSNPGTIYLYFVPTGSITLVLYTRPPIITFANLGTSISSTLMPKGYLYAFRLDLCRALCAEFGIARPDWLTDDLIESAKGALRSQNILPSIATPDFAATGDGGDYEIKDDNYHIGLR